MSSNLRITLCVLVIYHVHSSYADLGVMDMLSQIATKIYSSLNLGAFNTNIYNNLNFEGLKNAANIIQKNDHNIVQERENKEMSLMQEIKAGRHGRGNVHLFGRHKPGGRMRNKHQRPLNMIDVRAKYDGGQ